MVTDAAIAAHIFAVDVFGTGVDDVAAMWVRMVNNVTSNRLSERV